MRPNTDIRRQSSTLASDNNSTIRADASFLITTYTNQSFRTRILHVILRPFAPTLAKPKKESSPGSPALKPDKTVRKICTITERTVQDIHIYDIVASPPGNGPITRRIYYFAGGGWQTPPSRHHWKFCAELARKLPNTAVSLVSYPLAPASPAPSTFPLLLELYSSLMTKAATSGERIVFAGDSAGGNIVLALAVEAAKQGQSRTYPMAILLISPAVTFPESSSSMNQLEKNDPILTLSFTQRCARIWAADWDVYDPRLSPLEADLSPLVDAGIGVYGVTGGYDVLTPDAISFRDKCAKAGVKGEWLDWDKQMHCFPLVWRYGFKESKEAVAWILTVLEKI